MAGGVHSAFEYIAQGKQAVPAGLTNPDYGPYRVIVFQPAELHYGRGIDDYEYLIEVRLRIRHHLLFRVVEL